MCIRLHIVATAVAAAAFSPTISDNVQDSDAVEILPILRTRVGSEFNSAVALMVERCF